MEASGLLRVAVLGTFRVSRGDVELPVAGTRLQGLVVRLALAGGRAVSSEALIDAIWDGSASSAAALHTLVSRLRRALGRHDAVAQVTGGYRLAIDAADVDALHFERLAAIGRDELRTGDAEAAWTALSEATALWGEHLGTEPAVVAAVAPAVATRLAQMSIEAVADLGDAELRLGRADAAAARLTSAAAQQPTDERTIALLMDALAAQGRQAEALAVYEKTRRHLADALGVDPGSALRERHLRLLRPERGHRAPHAPGTNVPAPLTSFVGREDGLDRIDALLAIGRLVTVLGPGGAGKTRLALEAARRRRSAYRDGVWFVDLAAVTEPAKIASAMIAAIGVRRGPMFLGPQPGDDLDVLVGELGGQEVLLVVDNCEHLVDAVAGLSTTLLRRSPRLRVLATSREPLAVDGEALVPLGPLPLPDPGDRVDRARATASVRLFSERAAAVRPDFDVDEGTLPDVIRVVRSLDGMPLALELAAARLRTLSLRELADGLSDRFRMLTTGSRAAPPRHRTLRAVIAWSWELLSPTERTFAERISVLPGGVTLASATAVCAGTAVSADDVPELLAALVDRSLLHRAPGYRMLETVREYGVDRLTETGDLDAARSRAAGHFVEWMGRADERLRRPGQLDAMRAIGVEYDNVIAALRHLCVVGDSARATALVLSSVWYWQMSGRQLDAAYWLGEVLALPGDETALERACVRAVHLLSRADLPPGSTAEHVVDRAEVHELAERLLAHPELPGQYRVFAPILLFLHGGVGAAAAAFERLADGDDVWLAGLAHLFQAELSENAGAPDRMRVHVEAALRCFRTAGDHWGRAAILSMRAHLRRYDDLEGALADLREARTAADDFGAPGLDDQVASDLRWIDLHIRRGDTDRALAMLDAVRNRASPAMLPLVDATEAGLRVQLGDLDTAGALIEAAEQGLGISPPDHTRTLVSCARAAHCSALGDLAGADEALRVGYEAALATQELPVLSVVAIIAAARAQAEDRHAGSAMLLGVAARLRGAHDRTHPQVLFLSGRGRQALGVDRFAAAYEEGWRLNAAAAVRAANPSP